MTYLIKVSVDADKLLQMWADNNGLAISEVDESIESILESEMGWLDCSGVYVIEVKEV